MTKNDPLKAYREKRDFRRTTEPAGGKGKPWAQPGFVIQKHAASTLHYDLRIEVGGRLKSWAVPKGPSTNPKDKRLAVATKDHPLDYADFEGVIPEGEYGAGTVLVWDSGSYRNLREKAGQEVPMEQAIDDGHIAIWLEGNKLKGGYALIHTGKAADKRWLLVKMNDEKADAGANPVATRPESVLSGRTIEEIAREGGNRSGPG